MNQTADKDYKALVKRVDGRATTDGDGVKIRRSLSPDRIAGFDPFLLLDEISSDSAKDYIGGFPDHPHRGFETVTYMLAGSMRHRDHLGNEGKLVPGSVQWMTAGSGIVHSEMPEQEQGLLHGFQLWVNLPASEKMRSPRYQEYKPTQIPSATLDSGHVVKVIAGAFQHNGETLSGPVEGISTAPEYFDIRLSGGGPLDIDTDPQKTAFIYVYHGEASVSANGQSPALRAGQLGLLGPGNRIRLGANQQDTRALLIAGRPLREPVAHWGPFVMNTREQVEQAMRDYRDGRLIV